MRHAVGVQTRPTSVFWILKCFFNAIFYDKPKIDAHLTRATINSKIEVIGIKHVEVPRCCGITRESEDH